MHFITAVYYMYAGFHKLSRAKDKVDVRVNINLCRRQKIRPHEAGSKSVLSSDLSWWGLFKMLKKY